MNFFKFRLMNEAQEVDAGGSSESSSSESFSNDSNLDTDEGYIEPRFSTAAKELGLDPSKYGLDENQSESSSEESQGSEEVEEAVQATEEKSYLDRVNSLGAIHGETPVKVESEEQLKELIQKGYDYTQKTQSLSEDRKAWDSEKSNAEKEINAAVQELNTHREAYGQQLQELEQWTFTLNELAKEDPDIHAEIVRAFERTQKQYANPVLNQQLSAVNKRLEEAEKKLSSREDKLILDNFESEKSQLQATEQSLKELGINVDWNEVKKQWASTGLPVKQVVGAIYFETIAKSQASKSKVEAVQKKTSAKPIGAGNKSRPGNKAPAIDRKLSYYEQAQQFLNQYK